MFNAECLYRATVHSARLSGQLFLYIHNNPLEAHLVSTLENWPYSSWLDYYGFREDTICNKRKAKQRIGLNDADFNAATYLQADEEIVPFLW